MSAGERHLWVVLPTGQQASGGWIDDTLRERAAEHGLADKVPLAGRFPRQRVESFGGTAAEANVQQRFYLRGWTDGLPIVAPTVGRVKEMLQFSERKAQDVLGEVEPLRGQATLEKIAANAVMAGCRPAHFPVVIAAVEAALDPAFNMRGVQTTDENVAPMLIVNGPYAGRIGMNSGFGALGPGWQANAAIGRALRLVMNNIGGGWPGAVSFAGLGQPARYTLCIAEAEQRSPWPPLHVEMGFAAATSTVTLTRAESVINVTGGLAEIASVMGSAASGFQILWSGRPTVVISPATADDLARKGLSRADARQWLYENARWPAEALEGSWLNNRIVAEGRWPDWVVEALKTGGVPPVRAPDDIVLVVAGGDIPIPQHVYCPSWGFPPACITREIVLPYDWERQLAVDLDVEEE